MRHSPLTQIDRGNVGRLRVAWTYRTGELATYQGTTFPVSAVAFEAVPLMVEGVPYFCTAAARTFALDAATGRELWVYDPKIDLNVNYSHLRAFDAETGQLLWQSRLPAGGQATPMTYAVGGYGPLGTKLGDYVVAYAQS